METAAPHSTEPAAPSPPIHPFTFSAVAELGKIGGSRLMLMVAAVALLLGATVSCLFVNGWEPVLVQSIRQLPEDAVIQQGQLTWPDTQPVELAANSFLRLIVDPAAMTDHGQVADLQFEFQMNCVNVSSILGFTRLPYPFGLKVTLSQSIVRPWWGAWRIWFIAGIAAGLAALSLLVWMTLALAGSVVVRTVSFFSGRESDFGVQLRVALASMLAGAALLAMGVLCYSLKLLPLVGLAFIFAVHLLLCWIYLFFSPFYLSRKPEAVPPANPFITEPVDSLAPESKPKESNNPFGT